MQALDSAHSNADTAPRTLIDLLLEEQGTLSAVSRFSQRHDGEVIPAQEKYYRDLIPLSAPGSGEQYAFQVNLKACSGCKACVSGCHSLNGLDEAESWRQVGLLFGGSVEEPYQQTVTAACHHCVEPACMHGCPVAAYEKDMTTGIVRHLDDQCIGCQYCVLKCPYDVPKFHAKKGIVRKCDMCQDRLRVGEAPACVQACPTQAISIVNIRLEDVRNLSVPERRMIAGAFDSSYTLPTTRYLSQTTVGENAKPADAWRLRLEDAHYPLVFMLVLTQLSVGLFFTEIIAGLLHITVNRALTCLVALVAALLGMMSGTLHLGRPIGAWRAFLGLRRSWLSREIVAFGVFVPLAIAYTGLRWLPGVATLLRDDAVWILLPAGILFFGFLGIFSSVMIYADTRREFWNLQNTTWKFFGSTLILGSAAAAAISLTPFWIYVVMVLLPLKLLAEAATFNYLKNSQLTPLGYTARVLRDRLWGVMVARLSLALLAMGLVGVQALSQCMIAAGVLALVCIFVGEWLERVYFFCAVKAPRMPGLPGSMEPEK